MFRPPSSNALNVGWTMHAANTLVGISGTGLVGSCRVAVGGVNSSDRYPPIAVVGRDVGPRAVQRRKQAGNASTSIVAQWCVALSEEKIRIWPYEAPARERLQALRVTAHVSARLTGSRNPHFFSLPRS